MPTKIVSTRLDGELAVTASDCYGVAINPDVGSQGAQGVSGIANIIGVQVV
ncbi:MAG: hypothetical protein WC369_02965 [Dehalococcoidales bacterium]